MRNSLIFLIMMALVGALGCDKPSPKVSSAPTKPIPIPLAQKRNAALPQAMIQPPPHLPEEKTEQITPYNPIGKPDPFLPTRVAIEAKKEGKKKTFPLEQFQINDFELVGVVLGSGVRKAMVQDLTGKGFFVQVGSRIGKQGGKVIRITEKEVVIREPYDDFMGQKRSRDIILKPPPDPIRSVP